MLFSVSTLIHSEGVLSGEYQESVQTSQTSSSTPNYLTHVFTGLPFCTGVLEQVVAIINLFPQSWEHEIVQRPWYAGALGLYFIGTKGKRPTTEKQPQTIILLKPGC